MGSAVAATLQNAGHEVYWVSEGRSGRTRERAGELRLTDAGTLPRLCEICEAIVSVCPPEFAGEVAEQVLACSFRGMYIDANAISPQRAERMNRRMSEGGATFVDASIIGLATREPGKVWIYFSGAKADEAAACFGTGGPLQPEAIGGAVGRASALKMCYAGYNKGSSALLCAVLAAAERLAVRDVLEQQWARTDPAQVHAAKRISRVAQKAWRFAPEMREIADTFEDVGVTPEFHRAAAEIYAQLEGFKDFEASLEEILCALGRVGFLWDRSMTGLGLTGHGPVPLKPTLPDGERR